MSIPESQSICTSREKRKKVYLLEIQPEHLSFDSEISKEVRESMDKIVDILRRNQRVFSIVRKAIKDFEQNHEGDEEVWFNELCFCLLTANSTAKRVLEIWGELCQNKTFLQLPLKDLSAALKQRGYRFYNKRAEYIVEARRLIGNLKANILSFNTEFEARKWLVAEVKGLGLKESSHFLRNVGYKNLAILDRHILRILVDYNLIQEIPSQLSKGFYYSTEGKLRDFAKKISLTLAELDLFLWYIKTGMILK